MYIAVTEGSIASDVAQRVRRVCRVAGIRGFALIIVYSGLYASALPLEKFHMWAQIDVISLGYGAILLGIVLGWPQWGRVLAHPVLRFVGVISYSLYI